jgi:hypothetical protein
MTFPGDEARDAEREAWNAALASGDSERIEQTKHDVLDSIFRRMMNDDPNYRQAGWTDQNADYVLVLRVLAEMEDNAAETGEAHLTRLQRDALRWAVKTLSPAQIDRAKS